LNTGKTLHLPFTILRKYPKQLSEYSDQATGWTTGVRFPTRTTKGTFLFATASSPDLRPSQPPIQWLSEWLFHRG